MPASPVNTRAWPHALVRCPGARLVVFAEPSIAGCEMVFVGRRSFATLIVLLCFLSLGIATIASPAARRAILNVKSRPMAKAKPPPSPRPSVIDGHLDFGSNLVYSNVTIKGGLSNAAGAHDTTFTNCRILGAGQSETFRLGDSHGGCYEHPLRQLHLRPSRRQRQSRYAQAAGLQALLDATACTTSPSRTVTSALPTAPGRPAQTGCSLRYRTTRLAPRVTASRTSTSSAARSRRQATRRSTTPARSRAMPAAPS